MLISFLYVQVPFALFHHHDHKPVCELSDNLQTHKSADSSKKHFHETTNTNCFLCSAHLLKEYSIKDFSFSFTTAIVTTVYSFCSSQFLSSELLSNNSRGPPVLA